MEITWNAEKKKNIKLRNILNRSPILTSFLNEIVEERKAHTKT